MNNSIAFQISVEDEQATDEELQAMLRSLAIELEHCSAEVVPVMPDASGVYFDLKMVEKGQSSSGLLAVKATLEALKPFGKWLYGRLGGTRTKVKFTHDGTTFEFESSKDSDLESTLQAFESFVLKIEAAKQAKHG